MSFKAKFIWSNGSFIPWEEANIHVLSHVVHYGTGAFEGLRAYDVNGKAAVFRLSDHTNRLLETCKIYHIHCPYSYAEINEAILQTIKKNELSQGYIRPLVFRGMGELGLNPLNCPVETIIAAWPWGKYLGEDALENGIKACVSTWQRPSPNTIPSLAKACGNYLNGQLIKVEALQNGYDEGIALNTEGYVCEGSGENIFLVKNNILYTPPDSASILLGITRDSVITLAKEMGYDLAKQNISRELLYVADEVFMTGTAAEITPVYSIDKHVIGNGKRGPITKKIQKAYFDILTGVTTSQHEEWLTFVG